MLFFSFGSWRMQCVSFGNFGCNCVKYKTSGSCKAQSDFPNLKDYIKEGLFSQESKFLMLLDTCHLLRVAQE